MLIPEQNEPDPAQGYRTMLAASIALINTTVIAISTVMVSLLVVVLLIIVWWAWTTDMLSMLMPWEAARGHFRCVRIAYTHAHAHGFHGLMHSCEHLLDSTYMHVCSYLLVCGLRSFTYPSLYTSCASMSPKTPKTMGQCDA